MSESLLLKLQFPGAVQEKTGIHWERKKKKRSW